MRQSDYPDLPPGSPQRIDLAPFPRPFFLIYSPTGKSPPLVLFGSFDEARENAERMSMAIPDHEFYVMQSVALYTVEGGRVFPTVKEFDPR